MKRTESWFRRQLAHVRECVAEADKAHTEQEIEAAEQMLAEAPCLPQQPLFSAPPHAGLISGGQPEPSGLVAADSHLGA